MLAGDYRKIVTKPGDLEGTEVWFRNMEDVETASEGQIRGIRVSFNLASSCYATMCLRELTKSTML
jgi:tRNA(Glu) U13 pseudouridine synthase TruD